MSKIQHFDITAQLQLKAIELLSGSINLPAASTTPLTNFNFNINIESQADGINKLVFVIVSVDIRSEDQNTILGSLSISCIYTVINFEEIIKVDPSDRFIIPPPLIEI